MSIEEKIIEFLKEQKGIANALINEIKTTTNQNKEGENLFYVRADIFGKRLGINYSNNSIYFAFDINGNYVGCVKVSVLNMIPPNQVEMEYWANEVYSNKGNMTTLSQDVIKEIFEEKVFDELKVREGIEPSSIESVMVSINPDNYASLAVASKLGFDETGMLHKSNYELNNNQSSIGL